MLIFFSIFFQGLKGILSYAWLGLGFANAY